MNTTAAPNTNPFKYRIVPVADIKPGDIIKISRRVVESVSVGSTNTAMTFHGGGASVFRNSDKVGVYRRTTPYQFAR